MVRKGIVLGHKISNRGIEVDKVKIKVIEKLSPPISVKGVRSFYHWYINDFSKITYPLWKLLQIDVKFHFDNACLQAYATLKSKLISAMMIVPPHWSTPFEAICDTSGIVVGVVLDKNMFYPIYYASKILNEA